MRLEQLEYVVEIARNNSMSIAAEKLHIAQPSLSQSIKQLEKELNTTIFTRSRNGSFLTEKGEDIYSKSCEILDLVQSLYPAGDSKKNINGTLNILTIPSFHPVVSKLLISTLDNAPKVKQQVKMNPQDKINQNLHSHYKKYDFVLTALPNDTLQQYAKELVKHYHVHLISENNIGIIASKHSPYATQKTISVSALKKIPLIEYSDSDNYQDNYLYSIIEKRFHTKLRNSIKVDGLMSSYDFVASGAVCILSTSFILSNLMKKFNDGDFIFIPLKEKISISYVLLHGQNKSLDPVQKLTLDFFLKQYPQMQEMSL